jgi:membrane associated rhomboid family serine protease
MGESDRYIEYRGKYKNSGINFNINSPVVLLVIFNFSIFLFVKFLSFGQITGDTSLVPFFYEKLNAFLVSASFKQTLYQPWSMVVYSFFHFEFLTILSNMLWLWCFGSILQSIVGNRHTIPVYLYGAVAGALAFMTALALQHIPGGTPVFYLYGANAAVLAVAVAATVITPDFRIFSHLNGGIPIWILTVIYLLVDLAGINWAIPAYGIAHAGGIAAGFLFALLFRRGIDGSAWMNKFYNWFINLFNPNKKEKKFSVKEKVFYNTGNRSPYNKTANVTQQRIDEILDKINQKGYQYLTDDEKNILKRAAEEEI